MKGTHASTVNGLEAHRQPLVSSVAVPTDVDGANVLGWFNNTEVDYGGAQLVHELFEQQVERTPDLIALSYEGTDLTYRELNGKANQLARQLQGRGAGPEKIVALCVERSLEMVIGLLGILKSGAAYVPLDPAYPTERLAYILRETGTALLLTQERLLNSLPASESETILLDVKSVAWSSQDTGNLDLGSLTPSRLNLAYVIYTSGSTGEPKGAMNEHGGVVNRLKWMQKQYGLTQADRVLQKTPISFDVSVWEFFWTLMAGARLVIARPRGHQDPTYLRNLIDETGVTTLHFVPSMLQVFLDQYQPGSCESVRHVVCSGEELPLSLEKRCLEHLPNAKLSNLYGPTEAAVDVTAWECQVGETGIRVPIGRPISNVRMYVLDPQMHPTPVGVSGEIFIGGIAVGRGYLHRPELTAERFIADPFIGDSHGRLYRTGDLGQWRPDGALEYLGRNDHQVKLRGFRIELGEIEALMLRSGRVREALVVAREDHPGEKRLVAYVVPSKQNALSPDGASSEGGRFVEQWQSIYDFSYKSGSTSGSPNFAGWNSSYTGLPIPEEEMREWLDCTVARVSALAPKRILEIGCGVGLLVERLAPNCEVYHGTDLSSVAVRELREWISTQAHLKHVEVSQREAIDLSGVPAGPFDTVILNSVTQHFPNIDYLVLFVERALERLDRNGRIFIGDVKSRDLLTLFHASVQLAKAGNDLTVGRLQARIRQAVTEEKQLVISPAFFSLLQKRFPKITCVDIELKRGCYNNELTAYRYDVVLHVGGLRSWSAADLKIRYDAVDSPQWLEQQLESKKVGVLQLTHVPNRRLTGARQLLKLLGSVDSAQTVSASKDLFNDVTSSGEDPESLWRLGERYGYVVECGWAHDSHDGEYSVRFVDPTREACSTGSEIEDVASGDLEITWERYANDPMALPRRQQLVSQLREELKYRLPDYMLPTFFVVLDAFPLTPNGKLNRRALPAPDLSLGSSHRYEAPQGEIEEVLAGIWQELLGVERVGRQDNFFELAGHSLLAVQMLERLRRAGLLAEVDSVFKRPTLAALAATLIGEVRHDEVPPNLIPADCQEIRPQMLPLVDLEREQIRTIELAVPGGARNIQDIYPLAPLQEGLLFHHMLETDGGDTYVLPTLLSLPSRQRLDELVAAVQWIIDRHDMLRSAVLWEGLPRPVQVVYRRAALPVEHLKLSPTRDAITQLKERMKPELLRLELRQAPLMRLQVVQEPNSDSWFALLLVHHIVDDGTSLKVLIADAVAHLEGRAGKLPEPVPFRNHVAQALAIAKTQNSEAFFKRKLADIDEPTAPFGLLDVRGDGSRLEEAYEEIGENLTRRTRAQAKQLGVSVATVFHAAWSIVVAHVSGRDDVVFGSVLLGRLRGSAGAQRIVGMFINTLPLRIRLRGVTANELVWQVHREVIDLLSQEQASLSVAQRCSGISGSAPLFTSVLNYRHSAIEPGCDWNNATGIRVLADQYRTNYPVTLSIDDLGQAFSLTAQTDRRIDPHRVNGYLHTALESLVQSLEQAPETAALALAIQPEKERDEVIRIFNATALDYPRTKLVHQLFEEQVERAPEVDAVVCGDRQLSYAQLNRKANQLARALVARGIRPDDRVAVYAERGVDIVIALLAILKSGGAYVPLDLSYPAERLAYMLKDSSPKVILTQGRLKGTVPESPAEVIALDDDWDLIQHETTENLRPEELGLRAEVLAYVIYTSGSTGTPKGVMIEHRNVVNLIQWHCSAFALHAGDRSSCVAALGFDAAGWEIWPPLSVGATLVLAPPSATTDPDSLIAWWQAQRLEVSFLPTPIAELIFSRNIRSSDRLRTLLVGGDRLRYRPKHHTYSLVNNYGPTESAVVATSGEIRGTDSVLHIGRPIANTRIYILDEHLRPVPIGVAGELYISGDSVARGYLNRPDLTAERFLYDPFSSEPRARMYRTGDLARWQSDGTIEYVGRNDEQVKIRGYRIELGEIEAQLARHRQVKDAIVIAREDSPGEKRLVGYVVGDRDAPRELATDEAPEALRNVVVDQWTTLYEDTYAAKSEGSGPSFVGWNSSYTGQPIPEPQMQEWLNCTVDRIRSLRPKKVLEIGCGVGLLLQHLAPQCSVYVGTDFSASALAQLRQWVDQRGDLKHVELLHRPATELDDLQPGSFDTVVINSVVQYFPDVEYLLEVLQGAVRLIGTEGTVFIGDVRHLPLLTVFHTAVQLNKAAPTVSVDELRHRIARAVAQDKELVIDPLFFQALPNRVAGISSTEIQLKRGRVKNELTQYRYDVVLHTGQPNAGRVTCQTLDWHRAVRSMSEFNATMDNGRWPAVRVRGIPNGRLSRHMAIYHFIETFDEQQDVGAICRRIDKIEAEEVDPEAFWNWGEAHGYDIRVTWGAHDSPEICEVELLDRSRAGEFTWEVLPQGNATKAWSAYANDPLGNSFREQLIPELRTYLKRVLPEYMVPSAWMVLKVLPLTPNGKVDRRALPAPELIAYTSRHYESPRGEVERTLASIWQDLLRVERVGRKDNFFDLGGHSLLATRVISRIQELLKVELPLRALFDAPRVEQLAAHIDFEASRARTAAQGLRRDITAMADDAVLARIAELEKELAQDRT